MPKWSILASFWKPEAYSQTVLPNMSNLMRQKLMENAKIQMRHFEGFLNTVQWLKITIQKSKVYSHCDKSQFFVHLYIFIDETTKRLFDTL